MIKEKTVLIVGRPPTAKAHGAVVGVGQTSCVRPAAVIHGDEIVWR